jgi:hypothetical protein
MQYRDFKNRFNGSGFSDDQIRRKYIQIREALEAPVSAVAVSAAGGGSTPARTAPPSLRSWNKSPYTAADTQNLVSYVNYLDEVGGSFSDTIELVGSITGPSTKFQGAIVAPNENIYFIPNGATAPAKFNVATNEFSWLGGNWSATGPAGGATGPIVSLSGTYHSGCLHPNGYIYGTPYQANGIIRINPATDTFDFVGATPSRIRCHGSVVAPNGKIYFIPEDSYTDGAGITYYWQYDPATDAMNRFGATAAGGIGLFRGGVLAPNGYIYTLPRQSGYVAKINPETLEITTFGQGQFPGPGGPVLWRGGVLASNGKIYGVPHGAQTVIEIDPSTDTVVTFGTFASGGDKWASGALAPNGKIYCFPFSASTVLEIDPATRTTREYGDLLGTSKWTNGIIHPNGYMYAAPNRANSVLKLGSGGSLDPNYPLSRELNNL